MATERASWTSGAPTTEFILYVDRVGQSVSGNYTTVRIYIRAYNRGSSGSYFNDSGTHRGWLSGYSDQDVTKSGTPFLPSGVATDAQRWSVTKDINVKHNSDGTRGAITANMTIKYGSNDITKTYSFNDFPDIDVSTAPPAPTMTAARDVTQHTATLDLNNNGDGGASVNQAGVYWSQNSDVSGASSATGLPTNYVFGIGGLARWRRYYARGRLANKNGWGAYSNIVNFMTLADNPQAPTARGIDNVSQTQVHYWFTGNDDGCDAGWAEWQVGYGTDPNGPQYYMNPGGGDAWIGGLSRNTRWYFWSRGRSNANIWSGWSDRMEAQTLAYNPSPPKPRYIDNITQTSVHYVFDYMDDDGGAGILEWQIAYGTDPNSASNYISVPNGDNWIGGLSPGQTYYFWVRGRNQQGWSDWGMYFASNGQRTTARTVAGARLKIAGVWREVLPLVKVNGAYRLAQPYVMNGGTWRRAV